MRHNRGHIVADNLPGRIRPRHDDGDFPHVIGAVVRRIEVIRDAASDGVRDVSIGRVGRPEICTVGHLRPSIGADRFQVLLQNLIGAGRLPRTRQNPVTVDDRGENRSDENACDEHRNGDFQEREAGLQTTEAT